MTAKQYLSQIARADNIIKNKLSEIYQLKVLSTSISATNIGERVQTSVSADKMGDMIAKIVDLQREAQEDIDKYTDFRKKAISQIESIETDNFYNVLYGRYIQYKTFEQIAKEMGYSWRQTVRIHGEALAEFEKRYQNEMLS